MFSTVFAAETHRKRVNHMRIYTHCRWQLDEVTALKVIKKAMKRHGCPRKVTAGLRS
jgi:hypothetical protein